MTAVNRRYFNKNRLIEDEIRCAAEDIVTERLNALAPYEDLFELSAMEAVCRLHRATSYLGKAFRSASSDEELEIPEIQLLLALSLNGVGRKVSPRQLAEISLMPPATVSVGISAWRNLA